MLRPTRATLVVGLSLLGTLGLIRQSLGQAQAPAARDPRVQAASTPAATATATTPTPAPTQPARPLLIGSIDVDRVLKDYDKFKVANETIRAESMERYKQLMDLANQGKQEQEKHARFKAGSDDQKRCEDRITQLKAQIEALRENSEREFTQKEAESMATIYNEVAAMASTVAKKRGMTFVVKYSDTPASGSEPNSVVAAMSRTMLYADPSVDISNDVISWLNYYYKQSGGPAPKATQTAMPGQPSAPAAGQAPAPRQTQQQQPAPGARTAGAPSATGRN